MRLIREPEAEIRWEGSGKNGDMAQGKLETPVEDAQGQA